MIFVLGSFLLLYPEWWFCDLEDEDAGSRFSYVWDAGIGVEFFYLVRTLLKSERESEPARELACIHTERERRSERRSERIGICNSSCLLLLSLFRRDRCGILHSMDWQLSSIPPFFDSTRNLLLMFSSENFHCFVRSSSLSILSQP